VRYLITGGSGYIGGMLIEQLAARDETELIVDVDLRPPPGATPKVEFVRVDVRDRGTMRDLLARHEIDALVHLAFIFEPIHDELLTYDVNLNGTVATLRAAAEAGTSQVLFPSSAVAYGAWPDNPVPITEEQPPRGVPDFPYARDKADADRACQLWAAQHPDRVMTIVRPCPVLGPNLSNFIVRGFLKPALPFLPLPDGHDPELQLVHEDDVVAALIGLLDGRAAGAFNLTGDGTITISEAAAVLGMRTRSIPMGRLKRLTAVSWRLHLPRTYAPAGYIDFLRYPWILSTEKLKSATGWDPRYDTRQTFEVTLRAKRRL
jgi:UDP-glucose 4-epimerase